MPEGKEQLPSSIGLSNVILTVALKVEADLLALDFGATPQAPGNLETGGVNISQQFTSLPVQSDGVLGEHARAARAPAPTFLKSIGALP